MEGTNKSKFNPMIIVIGVVALILIGGFMLLSSNKSSDQSASSSNQGKPVISNDASNIKTINIEAGSFYFNPKEIRAKKGDTITIVLKAADMMHNFNIDEFNVKSQTIKAGEIATVQFTVHKIGEFEYYCSVANHRQKGQIGKLIVTK